MFLLFSGPPLDQLLEMAIKTLEQGLNEDPYQRQALTLLLWVSLHNAVCTLILPPF